MPLLTTLASDALSGYGFSRGGAPATYELISSQVLASTSPTITFSSISSAYTHLELRYTARSNGAVTSAFTYLRCNSDTGTNYSWHTLNGNGSAAASTAGSTVAQIQAGVHAGNSATSGIFSTGIIQILDYKDTNKYKTIRALSGNQGATLIHLVGGNWRSTSAITTLTITDSNANSFQIGSRFSLYGIKGA